MLCCLAFFAIRYVIQNFFQNLKLFCFHGTFFHDFYSFFMLAEVLLPHHLGGQRYTGCPSIRQHPRRQQLVSLAQLTGRANMTRSTLLLCICRAQGIYYTWSVFNQYFYGIQCPLMLTDPFVSISLFLLTLTNAISYDLSAQLSPGTSNWEDETSHYWHYWTRYKVFPDYIVPKYEVAVAEYDQIALIIVMNWSHDLWCDHTHINFYKTLFILAEVLLPHLLGGQRYTGCPSIRQHPRRQQLVSLAQLTGRANMTRSTLLLCICRAQGMWF